jgi:8-oxo-dGTP pyrophosphatase MutT (NUDIX family)
MRKRATAVVIRGGKVLLVREKGLARFSLPGGAIENEESVVGAAVRELYEELGLHSTKVTRLSGCDYKGAVNEHKVCLVQVEGEPQLRGQELAEFIWWDIKEPVAIYPHVKNILKEVQKQTKVSLKREENQN